MMDQVSVLSLVVEDDPGWQQILSEILEDSGLEVDVAENVHAAVSQVRSNAHRLAIVDLSLDPEDHRNQDGLDVLEALRQFDPGCVALLLTGYATVELAVDIVTQYGAFTCLRKEAFQRAHFRQLVQQALASSPRWIGKGQNRELSVASTSSDVEAGETGHTHPAEMALVVEDDAGWRSILAELLAEIGYQVRLCNGFGEALGCLSRDRYSVAVIDLSLSGETSVHPHPHAGNREPDTSEGYRLLASTQAAGIPTILVSGVAALQEIERAYQEYGIFACLEKQTFDLRAFRRTIAALRKNQHAMHNLGDLTERELQVLKLLSRGMTNQTIAENLNISANTVKRHLKTVYEKLGVHTRAAAAAQAVSAGIASGWSPAAPHED